MEILVTNDDGVDAPGILALEKLARELGNVWVFAPSGCRSGCSHRVTTESPLKMSELRPGVKTIDGTPADCVRLALHCLGKKFDWVFAGINSGGNLGVDIHLSGTVAAVREAAIHEIPGIAFSQYRRRGRDFDWDRSLHLARQAMASVMKEPWQKGFFWNVNLPHLDQEIPDPPLVCCHPNPGPLPLEFHVREDRFHYAGDYHARAREPGSDVDVCFRGKVALSRLGIF
ncbi:MAG: 5'/3'-nucleotidase SurE [Gemmataceae bacterium]|nr:5'/3'-nucleotidase SurE [Gemmataceae bacterium]